MASTASSLMGSTTAATPSDACLDCIQSDQTICRCGPKMDDLMPANVVHKKLTTHGSCGAAPFDADGDCKNCGQNIRGATRDMGVYRSVFNALHHNLVCPKRHPQPPPVDPSAGPANSTPVNETRASAPKPCSPDVSLSMDAPPPTPTVQSFNGIESSIGSLESQGTSLDKSLTQRSGAAFSSSSTALAPPPSTRATSVQSEVNNPAAAPPTAAVQAPVQKREGTGGTPSTSAAKKSRTSRTPIADTVINVLPTDEQGGSNRNSNGSVASIGSVSSPDTPLDSKNARLADARQYLQSTNQLLAESTDPVIKQLLVAERAEAERAVATALAEQLTQENQSMEQSMEQ